MASTSSSRTGVVISTSTAAAATGPSSYCYRCGAPEGERPLLSCAGCGGIAFCSKPCQLDAWRDHKASCRAAAASKLAALQARVDATPLNACLAR